MIVKPLLYLCFTFYELDSIANKYSRMLPIVPMEVLVLIF